MAEQGNRRVAILASGSGSTAEAFIRATQGDAAEGYGVTAEVGVIVCNNTAKRAGIYERVNRLNKYYGLGIDVVHISGRTHPDGAVGRGQTLAESAAVRALMEERDIAHVALMGYMKQVRGELVAQYGWRTEHTSPYQARMTNTHPGPLPLTADTFGVQPSEIVIAEGLPASRHTVHLVAEGIDTGPMLAEHVVPVLGGDTPMDLFERVQVAEKAMLPGVIDIFLTEQEAYRAVT